MTTDALAAIARTRDGPLSVEQVLLDDQRPGELLVRIEACGICHTDQKFRERLPLPALLGHEGVGMVEAVGAEVRHVRVGDRVLISYPFCTACPACRRAEPWCCERIAELKFGGCRLDGSQPVSLQGAGITSAFFQQSSFATHAITLEQSVVPVSDQLPAGTLAALPCGVQTGAGAVMNTFDARPGDSLMVFGAGAVGMSAIMAARVLGIAPILCAEPHAGRRALATELGATGVFDPGDPDLIEQVRAAVPGGVRFALDTSATVAGLENAIEVIGKGGAVGIVSYPDDGRPFPFSTQTLFARVGRLIAITQGSSVPGEFLPKLIDLHLAGEFPVDRLVRTYPFRNINDALADAEAGDVVKPVLLMPGT